MTLLHTADNGALHANDPGRPLVGIVVVNYNNYPDTKECLGSLAQLEYENHFVVVVDNCSTDGSANQLAAAFPGFVLLRQPENLGFAGGNNVGIGFALRRKPKYIWMINNDAVVRADSLGHLVEMAERHPTIDFFGSWIVYYGEPSRIWFGGGGYRWISGYIAAEKFNEILPLEERDRSDYPSCWVTGCSLLARANVILRTGLLDESFFLYREEMEWQLREHAKSPRAMISPKALVMHKVGRTTGTSGSYLGTLFMSRNYLKLASKYAGPAIPFWLSRWFAIYVVSPVFKGQLHLVRAAAASLMLYGAEGKVVLRAAENATRR